MASSASTSGSNAVGVFLGLCGRSAGSYLNILLYSGGLSDCDVIHDSPSHCEPLGIPDPNIGTGTPFLPATPMQNTSPDSVHDGDSDSNKDEIVFPDNPATAEDDFEKIRNTSAKINLKDGLV